MTKQQKSISATQQLREAIPKILQETFESGATFEELWDALAKDKDLKKIMHTKENKPRTGLLQGLTNRIKAGKEENIAIIKKDGKNLYIFCDNSIQKLILLTNNYLDFAKIIDTTNDSNLTKEKEALLQEHSKVLVKLTEVTEKLSKTK